MEKHDETADAGIEARPAAVPVIFHQVSQNKCVFNRSRRERMEAIGENTLAESAEEVLDILDANRDRLFGFDNFVMLWEFQKFKVISEYEHVFNHFDGNGDGKISQAELRQCVEAMGVDLSANEVEAALAFLDMDGDGPFGFKDFVTLVERLNEEDTTNDFKEAFEMYDEMDNDIVFKFFGRRAVGRWIMRNYKSALVCSNGKAYRATNLLPISRNDLKNSLHQKPFLCFAIGSTLDISPQQHGILLTLFGSILSYLAKNSTTPFEFRFGKTTNTPQSLISLDEAFYAFMPEMAHITMFIICYIMTWMLVLPLRPGMKMFLVLLLISAPLFYFPELVRKASTSGVIVTCGGSFKLPLIGFTTLAAFGITLIFGLVALLVVYLNKRFIHGTPTKGQDIEVTDGLLSVISNV